MNIVELSLYYLCGSRLSPLFVVDAMILQSAEFADWLTCSSSRCIFFYFFFTVFNFY